MHVKKLLHKFLEPVMHKKRLSTLLLMVLAGLKSKRLSLTLLGRSMPSSAQERSCIRRSDRLLGNKHLQKERIFIYKIITNRLINLKKHPSIIVDWSKMPNNTMHVLRAALVTKGRALTLYDELHPESKLGNKKTQNAFLDQLKFILPDTCKPIIITDAGFHPDWFRKVASLKWDYIGRIRSDSRRTYRLDGHNVWEKLLGLYKRATHRPELIGEVLLYKSKPIKTHLYLYKGKHKGRKLLNRSGKERCNTRANKYKKSARDPWLLASSLSGPGMQKKIINEYSKRMQIEEGFRDLKSSQYGLGFEYAYSKSIERIQALMLIGMLITFIAWLTGIIAEKNSWHLQFQSNSTKHRRVLSLFYLGCQVIRRKLKIPVSKLEEVLQSDFT